MSLEFPSARPNKLHMNIINIYLLYIFIIVAHYLLFLNVGRIFPDILFVSYLLMSLIWVRS